MCVLGLTESPTALRVVVDQVAVSVRDEGVNAARRGDAAAAREDIA